jgi:hypothetical protein
MGGELLKLLLMELLNDNILKVNMISNLDKKINLEKVELVLQ